MPTRKIKLTRPELKAQRDMLARFERYLPTLKLKQQLLQASVLKTAEQKKTAEENLERCSKKIDHYKALLGESAGIDLSHLTTPSKITTVSKNIAGVSIPQFKDISFPPADYSLLSTPPWVDVALSDLQEKETLKAKSELLLKKFELLQQELKRVNQRLNLFEKVMIPQTQKAIQIIRIYLGDEQTAAVGRAKMAKRKQLQMRAKDKNFQSLTGGET